MGKSTDLSRAERKSKKRALEDAIPDLPVDDDTETAPVEAEKVTQKLKKRKRDGEAEEEEFEGGIEERKEKKVSKKRRKTEDGEAGANPGDEERLAERAAKKEDKKDKGKRGASAREEGVHLAEEADTNMGEEGVAPKKSKKERKAERKAREAAGRPSESSVLSESNETVARSNADAAETAECRKSKKNNRNREKKRKGTSANGEASAQAETRKPPRFIVFIGNLPFTATTESITAHLASVKPKSVRHLTQKDNPSKSRGCAFVEFEGYDHMKTCLKLFHHSTFDDGLSPPRKINVELTAGGGGNTKDRKLKIHDKNQKLNDERFRRIQDEEKAKAAKGSEARTIHESAIHPSRRGRVPTA